MAGRFSFSVPERRHGGDPWFRVGQVDVTTTVLVTAACVLSLLIWVGNEASLVRIALIPSEVRGGEIWRVATWPLANIPPNRQLFWAAISIALFWYFGREVESLMGRNRFAGFLGALTLVPGVIGALVDAPAAGIRPLEFAIFLVFVAHNPFARFLFGIPAWVLGAVLLAIEVLQLLADDDSRGIIFLAVTLGTAALLARSMGLAESAPWIPALPIPGFTDGRSRKAPRRKKPSRGRDGGDVVAGPWSSSGRSRPTAVPPLPQPPTSPGAVADQAELDDLLDKISSHGMDGLSSDEKRRLNELSKRMRGPR